MKKSSIWGIVLLIIVVIIVVVSTNTGSKSETMSNEPIRIGFIGPLTGGAAPYGEPAANAVKLAVSEINKAGGVNGRTIEVTYEDGKCSGTDASTAAQKLVSIDKVTYIIGAGCSGESFSIIPIITSAKVTTISPISSAPKLSGASPYFLRNNPNDNLFGPLLADYLAKQGLKKVAILAEQTDYGQQIKTVFAAELVKNGQTLVASQDYTSDSTDFRSLLSKIKDAKPDVVFIAAQNGANFIRATQQARALNLNAPIANVYLGTDPAIASSTTVLEGTIFADLPGLSTEKGKQFLASYQQTYKSTPSYPFYAGAAYDDAYLFAQAIKIVGDDSTKVAQYLHSMPAYTGSIGTYSFDQNGDITGYQPLFQKIEKGKLVDLQ